MPVRVVGMAFLFPVRDFRTNGTCAVVDNFDAYSSL